MRRRVTPNVMGKDLRAGVRKEKLTFEQAVAGSSPTILHAAGDPQFTADSKVDVRAYFKDRMNGNPYIGDRDPESAPGTVIFD